jgi:cytochrome b involved in lipid metabolism
MDKFLRKIGVLADLPTFTLEEVQLHNTAESMYIIAGDRVYDVTSLIDNHPGGNGALFKRAGANGDCTIDYNFHSKKARKQWQERLVGYVKTNK